MPAVDPDRLDREIRAILRSFSDPPRLARQVLDHFEFYADRAKRSAAQDGHELNGNVPRVAQPVLRIMQRRFAAAAAADPDQSLIVSQALWETGWIDARLLAASILEPLTGNAIPGVVEAWSLATRDRSILRALAQSALSGWRRAHPDEFLKRCRTWLRARKEPKRILALCALQSAVEDPAFPAVPAVLESLERLAQSVRGDSRRALHHLIEALAERTPVETARFLLDELEAGVSGADRLIRACIEAFPSRQQASLQASLSAHRQAGIIRRT